MKSTSLIPFLFVLMLGGSHAFCIYNEAAFDIHIQSFFASEFGGYGRGDYGLKIPPGGREVSETLTTE